MTKEGFCPAGVLLATTKEIIEREAEPDRTVLTTDDGIPVFLEMTGSAGLVVDPEGECGFEGVSERLDTGVDFAARRCGFCKAYCVGWRKLE